MLSKAIQLFENGDYDAAEALFVRSGSGEDAQKAQVYLARIALLADRKEDAIGHLEQAAKPEDSALALAHRLMNDERPELAELLFRKAVRETPEALEPQLWLGHALAAQDKLKQAVSAYERAITLDTRAPEPRYALAAALMWLGDLARAASQVQVVLQAVPNDPDARVLRAELALMQEDFRQAAVEYQKAVELGRVEPEIFERLAASWWFSGNVPRALEIYEAGFSAFPSHWPLYEDAALMCEEAGWYTRARRFYLALVYDPSHREAAQAALGRLEGRKDAAPTPALIPVAATAITPKAPPGRDSVTERLRAASRQTGPLGRPGSKPLQPDH